MSSRNEPVRWTSEAWLALALAPAAALQVVLLPAGRGASLAGLALAALAWAVASSPECVRRPLAILSAPSAARVSTALFTAMLCGLLLPVEGSPWLPVAAAALAGLLSHLPLPGRGLPVLAAPLACLALRLAVLPHGPGLEVDAITGATVLGEQRLWEFVAFVGHVPSLVDVHLGIWTGSGADALGLPVLGGAVLLMGVRATAAAVPGAFVATVVAAAVARHAAGGTLALTPLYHLLSGEAILVAGVLAADVRLVPRSRSARAALGVLLGLAYAAARGVLPIFHQAALLACCVAIPAAPLLARLLPVKAAPAIPPPAVPAPATPAYWVPRPWMAIALAAAAVIAELASGGGDPEAPLDGNELLKPRAFDGVEAPAVSPADWVAAPLAGVDLWRTPVTVAQYAACVAAGACFSGGYEVVAINPACNAGRPDRWSHPMNCVNPLGAAAFCAWVGGRLPAEHEWEAEATEGGTRTYPWGSDPAGCTEAGRPPAPAGGCSSPGTWPVCARPGRTLRNGFCDLGGNVAELAQVDPDRRGPAWGSRPADEPVTVARSGGWSMARLGRQALAHRTPMIPTFRGMAATGFRCARSPASSVR